MFTVQLSDGVYIVRFRTIKARERFGSILRRTNSIRDANRNNQNYALPPKQERPKTVICSILHKDATPHTWADKGQCLWDEVRIESGRYYPMIATSPINAAKIRLYDSHGAPFPMGYLNPKVYGSVVFDNTARYAMGQFGISHCNPLDDFDPIIGKKVALSRGLHTGYGNYKFNSNNSWLFNSDERQIFWCEFWKWIKSWKPQPEFTIKDLSGSELVELDTEPDMVRRRSSVYECGDEEEATALSWNRKVISS